MMILDVIQDADSEYVIFFLLAAYLEAALFAGKLPEYMKSLPIVGGGDVAMRYQRLMTELHEAAREADHTSCLEMQDALRVFDAALCRLAFLERVRESSRSTVSGSPGRYESQVAGSSPSPPSHSPA